MVKKGPPSPKKRPTSEFKNPPISPSKAAENRLKRNALDYKAGSLIPHISLIALSVTLAFSGILKTPGKEFVNYDDDENFSHNRCIKSISVEHIICAFTRQTMGV